MASVWLIALVAVAAGGLYYFSFSGLYIRVPSTGDVTLPVAKAAVAGKWDQVAKLLEKVDDKTPSPALRILKAHALLATNQNNESQCLLLGASKPDDAKKWLDWTKEFARLNPKQATAHYLLGDAFARNREWNTALQEFTKAIEAKPGYGLALSARGLAHAINKEVTPAMADLTLATQSNPRLADAFASQAMLTIQDGTASDEVVRLYTNAISANPSFVLARYGRAAVYLALNTPDKAVEDLELLEKTTYCMSRLFRQKLQDVASRPVIAQQHAAADSGSDPAMAVKKEFERNIADLTSSVKMANDVTQRGGLRGTLGLGIAEQRGASAWTRAAQAIGNETDPVKKQQMTNQLNQTLDIARKTPAGPIAVDRMAETVQSRQRIGGVFADITKGSQVNVGKPNVNANVNLEGVGRGMERSNAAIADGLRRTGQPQGADSKPEGVRDGDEGTASAVAFYGLLYSTS